MVRVKAGRKRDWSKTKHLTLTEDSYWKLQELRAWLKVSTWEELIDELYKREKRRRFVF